MLTRSTLIDVGADPDEETSDSKEGEDEAAPEEEDLEEPINEDPVAEDPIAQTVEVVHEVDVSQSK
jgi:hypothetical protein